MKNLFTKKIAILEGKIISVPYGWIITSQKTPDIKSSEGKSLSPWSNYKSKNFATTKFSENDGVQCIFVPEGLEITKNLEKFLEIDLPNFDALDKITWKTDIDGLVIEPLNRQEGYRHQLSNVEDWDLDYIESIKNGNSPDKNIKVEAVNLGVEIAEAPVEVEEECDLAGAQELDTHVSHHI